MADSNVFDSVFKTMLQKLPGIVVPFVNEAFGRDHPAGSTVERRSAGHEGPAGATIADSVFEIGGKTYHVECQSTPDSTMVVRMIEYDFAIALEGAIDAGAPYEMNLPSSCVLFLRHAPDAPGELKMRVNTPDGDSFTYRTRAVNAQSFSEDELFDKGLLMLLPYRIMRHEKRLGEIAADEGRLARLTAECARLRSRLERAASGDKLLYRQLVELIIRVSDYVLAPHGALRKEVRKAMGGEVLELMDERVERVEREAREAEQRGMQRGMERGMQRGIEQGLERGIEQGLERGLERGIEQGLERGVDNLSAILAERGVDAALLEEAAAIVRNAQKA